MSTFCVELKKIEQIKAHSNADRLELGMVNGLSYQFVVQKGLYNVGDSVVYFPIDSVLPPELIEFLEIGNLLAGNAKNRIKTVRLRGEVSQGYVVPATLIQTYLKVADVSELPENLTEALNVIKYEPPEVPVMGANLTRLPEHNHIYDIENFERHPEVYEYMLDKDVYISEKVEGSHFSLTVDVNGGIHVCQRKHEIFCLPDFEEHTWWKTARKDGLLDLIKKIQEEHFSGKTVTIRGEMLGPGIQGNYYNLKEHTIKLFELEVDGVPQGYNTLLEVYGEEFYKERSAPLLYTGKFRDFIGDSTIQKLSNGKSVLNKDKLREGIVVKLMVEEMLPKIGRVFLKQRDPIYLDKTGH